jgi:Protein of unknown function (DUF3156)
VQRFAGPAQQRALRAFDDAVERFARAGRPDVERLGPLRARLAAGAEGLPIRLEMARDGRILGGAYGLEISTDEPVLPPTRGLSVRARGVVKMQGLQLRPRRGDRAGRDLAARLSADARLAELLGKVHFERVRVEPDGRPVIRHLGGSVVWILFPPLVRQIPFVGEQATATLAALEGFAAAGRQAS